MSDPPLVINSPIVLHKGVYYYAARSAFIKESNEDDVFLVNDGQYYKLLNKVPDAYVPEIVRRQRFENKFTELILQTKGY